jgi:dTDP-4-amino-4,6-dideoxygalactose transaminase
MFYLTCHNIQQRTAILEQLKQNNIFAVFHYISLHSSPFYNEKHDGRKLENTDKFTDCLIRLPLFFELESDVVINELLKQ